MFKPITKPVLTFIIFLFLCLPFTINSCHHIQEFNFDTQNGYYWDYLPSQGVVPIKDTFYIYGYLAYYKSGLFWVFLIYSLVCPLIYTCLYYLCLKPLFPSRLVRAVALICLVLFTHQTLGVHALSRYGLLLLGALFASRLTTLKSKTLPLFLLGLVDALLILASTADGLYATLLSIIILSAQVIFTKLPFRHLTWFLAGFGLGLTPFIYLNTRLQNPSGYWVYLKQLLDASQYAKVPFDSSDRLQMVIFGAFAVTVFILTVQLLRTHRQFSYPFWLAINFTLAALIMHQKNLVRPSTNATIVYVLILLFALYGLSLRRLKISPLISALFLIVLTFTIGDIAHLPLNPTQTVQKLAFWYRNPPQNLRSELCDIQSAQPQKLDTTHRYTPVVDYLNHHFPGQAIFPFPYDPVFYTFLRQKPAPYPNFYDASSLDAQQANIAFMEQTPVTIVIYDLGALVFDSVPETVRNVTEFRYILAHYYPLAQIGDMVLLSRVASPQSWFTPAIQQHYPALFNRLTHLNWSYLPKSEGLAHTITATGSATLNPQNNLLKLKYAPSVNAAGLLTLTTASASTQITFHIAQGGDYLFNLQNVPLLAFPPDHLGLSIIPPPANIFLFNPSTNLFW